VKMPQMSSRLLSSCMFAAAISLAGTSTSALAEIQCAPQGASVQYPTTDKFYLDETASWTRVTKARYLEGAGASACTDVTVSGYEGYPTKKCSYQSVDAGADAYPTLPAQVILLNPSAQQLSSWSIHACRTNGATDAQMAKCLQKLRDYVVVQNGAQFPVAGSVVESYCNSSPSYPNGCRKLSPSDKGRQPRNTWFRNGVSIDYKADYPVRWDAKAYPSETFDAIFDVVKSDAHVNNTFKNARVSGAIRQNWIDWRKHIAKPMMPEGMTEKDIKTSGWQSVSREVHKAACKSDSNELFDALVFANRKAWIDD